MPPLAPKVPGGFAVAHNNVVCEAPIPDREGPESEWETCALQQRAGTFDYLSNDPFGI